jgi:pyruvate/2-oxoacid:ferredoxin oxidoreductase alpha subunit
VALCRPQVICAYPITPQTHIVEALGTLVKKGELNAGFLNVESEFAAMSAVIGASAAGARTYTATASQGGITSFRPFPAHAVRAALGGDRRPRRLIVIERAVAPGSGGTVTSSAQAAASRVCYRLHAVHPAELRCMRMDRV